MTATNPPIPVERLTLTVTEAATIVGVSRSTLYEHVKDGRVPSVRVGRRVVIPVGIVTALLSGLELQQTQL